MEKPLVSIIIPVFNQAGYLAETIDSVLAQEYPHTEVIVLDDGSTDGTSGVIHAYRDSIKAVRHENVGENKTVNRGLDLAQGAFFCVVNADDPIFPRAIEAAVTALVASPRALVAYPDWVEIDSDGNIVRKLYLPEYDIRQMMLWLNVAIGPGVLLRREVIDVVGKRNSSLLFTGDLDYWFRVAMQGDLLHVPELLATHRVHSQAASTVHAGVEMAREVVGVVKRSLYSPGFPSDLWSYRTEIRRKMYRIARRYCGSDLRASRSLLLKEKWCQFLFACRRRLTGLRRPVQEKVLQEVVEDELVCYRKLFEN